jgi:poly(3-hydroxybutyrate) depolymerase
MNLSSHVDAHQAYFQNLVRGDGEPADKHRKFYDEYLAVMDLTEEFYIQTLEEVFQKYSLANGTMLHRGVRVDPGAITKTALLTVEGENDDISGIGQTQAAHELCVNIPEAMQRAYIQPGVGHYGVFSGRRFKQEIYPRKRDFMRKFQSEEARADRRGKLKLVAD